MSTARDPLRKPQELTDLKINNSEDWLTIFSALVSSKQNRGEVRVFIPETIFISPNGVASSWYHTSTKGVLKSKDQRHINYRAIQQRFGELPHQQCILRHGFTSRVLRSDVFSDTVAQLQNFSSQAEQRPDQQQMPFCLQQFIEPADNSRYVTTFMPIRTCQTFRLDFSARYKQWQTQDGADAQTQSTNLVDTTLVLEKCKRSTMALVNWINKGQGTLSKSSLDRKTRKLNGVVVEYIVGKHDGELYLNAILGTLWQGDGQDAAITANSWQGMSTIDDPEVTQKVMSLTTTHQAGKKTKKKMLGSQSSRAPNNMLPDIGGRPTTGPRPSTVGDKRGRSVRGTNSTELARPSTSPAKSTSLAERKAGFVVNRPPLVVELSQQLEIYKEKLQQLTERCLEAEDEERKQSDRAQTLGQHNRSIQGQLSGQSSSGMAQSAELLQTVATLREERKALQQAFTRRDAALQASREHVAELRQTLTKERAVAFDLLGDLKHKAEALESELEAQVAKQNELDAARSAKTATLSSGTQVNSDLRRDLMLKNQHVESLQQEIAEFKIQGAQLRQDNVALNRFLPIRDIGGRFSVKDQEQPGEGSPGSPANGESEASEGASLERTIKLNVSDVLQSMELYNSSPAVELELLRQTAAQFNTLFRLIFKFYKGQLKLSKEEKAGSSSSADLSIQKRRRSITLHGANKNLVMKEFMQFIEDCGVVSDDVNEEFNMSKLDAILVTAGIGTATSLSRGGKSGWTISFAQFCELLVRIGMEKNQNRFAADRFAKLVEKEVFPAMDQKIYQLMDELA